MMEEEVKRNLLTMFDKKAIEEKILEKKLVLRPIN